MTAPQISVRPMDVVVFIALGVAGWVLYKLLDKGADAISEPIADLWVAFTAGPVVSVNAGAMLPSGARVTFDEVVAAGSSVNARNEFKWQGRTYRLTGRRLDGGWYEAQQV